MSNSNTYRRRPRTTVASRVNPLESVAAVFVIVALFAVAWTSGHTAPPTLVTGSVRVVEGDSLWSLAERYPVKGHSTAETVELIAQLNGLESPLIIESMVLEMPTETPQTSATQVAQAGTTLN